MTFVKYEKPPCSHSGHNPPMHIVLSPGIHTWKCPGCGAEQRIIVPQITLNTCENKNNDASCMCHMKYKGPSLFDSEFNSN